MANDRLYIVCKRCGEKRMLAKWWGDHFEVPSHPVGPLGMWLTDHWLCEPQDDSFGSFGLVNEAGKLEADEPARIFGPSTSRLLRYIWRK